MKLLNINKSGRGIVLLLMLCCTGIQIQAQQNKKVARSYVYDENGQVVFWPGTSDTLFVESQNFFDKQGKSLQSQSRVNSHGSQGIIVGTQNLYDRFGRLAISTLPAPMGAPGTGFGYNGLFVRNSAALAYNYNDFDKDPNASGSTGKLMNPDYVSSSSSIPYTLGWYYSPANQLEDDVPVSQYPYTRTAFKGDGSNEVRHITLPGYEHRMGQDKEQLSEVRKVDGEMDEYINLRHAIVPMNALINAKAEAEGHIHSTVIRTDVLTADETVHISPTGVLILEPGFNTNGYEFETKSNDAAYYVKLKEKAIYEYVRDPNGGEVHRFKDMNDQVIAAAYSTVSSPTLKGWTYNFYDDNKRLVASISPNGVEQWRSGASINNIDKSTYEYNHRGWVISIDEPDAGKRTFKYRLDGKERFSQNEVQAQTGAYSYTNYDASGRPIESGEVTGGYAYGSSQLTNGGTGSILEQTGYSSGVTGTRSDWLKSFYDVPATNIQSETGLTIYSQDFVVGAVSYTENENIFTWYSYNDAGEVVWMLRKPKGLAKAFAVEYDYDFNGNIRDIAFKEFNVGSNTPVNTFEHQYDYDMDLRMVNVKTRFNGGSWQQQATYDFYVHGPIKRIVLGDDLQGLDFLYTVQGWLKGVNHPTLTDPGGDGPGNGVEKDVFAFGLEYYDNDYATAWNTDQSVSFGSSASQKYDGTIRGVTWKDPVTDYQQGSGASAYAYNYDDQYQLSSALHGSVNSSYATFTPGGNNLKVDNLTYDKNGNLQTLRRYNASGGLKHNFTYSYPGNDNKLTAVSGHATYQYDQRGSLVKEVKANGAEQNLSHNLEGLVTEVRDENNVLKVANDYDDLGFRLKKTAYNSQGQAELVTWYIRDNSGKLLGVYHNQDANGEFSANPSLKEVLVYGSKKLGTFYTDGAETAYELTDYRGNVRAVVANEKSTTYQATFQDTPWAAEESKEFDLNNADRIPDGVGSNKVARIPAGGNGLLGPSRIVMVMPGDAVSISATGGYATGSSTSYTTPTSLLGTILNGLTGNNTLGEMLNTSIQNANVAPGIISSIGSNSATTDAYLNWIYFDNNFNFKTGGFTFVPSGYGKANRANLSLNIPESVIDQPGYIYVYATNESTVASEAYFDNLTITHNRGIVRSVTGYYPYGSQVEENSFSNLTPLDYRFGFQGHFAERDEETGWNSFQLRMNDPVIGRWLTIDPYREYSSPYISMGNNPITLIDPDGGCNECLINIFIRASIWWHNNSPFGSNSKVARSVRMKYENAVEFQTRGQEILEVMAEDENLGLDMAEAYKEEMLIEEYESDLLLVAGLQEWFAMSAGAAGNSPQMVAKQTYKLAFWSGGGVKGGGTMAQYFAKKAGFKVLADTKQGARVLQLTKNMPWDEAKPLWEALSKDLAKNAPMYGKAHVYLTREALENNKSIWMAIEKNILESRGAEIIYHFVDF